MAVDDIRFRPAPQPQPTGSEDLARSTQRPSGVKVQPQSLRAPVDAFEGTQGRPTPRARQDEFTRGGVAQRELWTEVRSGAGVDLPIDLSSIGLTQEDLVKAGEQAAPYLQKAAQAFLAGDKQGALTQLKEAAKAGVPDLAEKALLHVSQSLSQSGPLSAARALLTDQAFVHQMVNTPEGLDALGKIATGDVGGGVRALVANKPLRDAALDVVARSPGVQEGLSQLGFDAGDLKRAGDAAPDVLDAAVKAASGDYAGAMESLEKAAPVAQDLVVKGVNNAARKLPETGAEGIARSLLSDPAFVRQLISDPSVRGAVGQILRGDVAGGLRAIAGNDALTEAAINALSTNKDVQAGMEKLGLTVGDLQAGRDALPDLVDAGMAAVQGDFKGALAKLGDAAEKAPEIVTRAVNTAAKSLLPNGVEGIAKSLLTDPKFVLAMVGTREGRAALKSLAEGKIPEALQLIASNNKLTSAAIDALAKNPDVKAGMDKLGLTVADLQASRGALPELVQAGLSAQQGDFAGALKHLKGAADKAPIVVEKAIITAARNLQDGGAQGVAKSLLTDPAFVKAMVEDPAARGALEQLADGKIGEGLKALAGSDAVTRTAIDALAKNPDVKAGLDRLGITVADLQASRGALPELVQAGIDASKGDFKAVLKDLESAAEKAPALIERAILNAASHLQDGGPEGIAKSLLTDPTFVKTMVEDKDARGALKLLAEGKVDEGLRSLAANAAVSGAAIDALAKNPDVKAGMDKLGLTVEDLQAGRDALPDLLDAAVAAGKGDLRGTFRSLEAAAGKAPEVVEKLVIAAAKNLPDGGVEGIVRSVLTDPAAVKQLVENEQLHSAIGRLAAGDLSALKDIALNEPARNAIADAVMNNPEVKAGLEKLGLTPEDVKGSFNSLVDVAQAARSLVQGDFQAAFKHLKDAGAALPAAVVEKAIMKAASYLPEQGPSGIMRSLLTDRGFVQQLVENPALKAAFDKMVSGSFEQGLKDVLSNPQFRDAAAGALANNADFMRRLSQFGITSAADISAVGKGIVDLMKAGEAVAQGDVSGALSAIGQAIRDTPAGVKTKILSALADKLHLPDWAKTAIVGLGGLIGNEEIARSLGNAVSAFGRGDIGGFVAGLASTGSLIAKQDPQLAVGFLDGLSHLPGTMGKLFADHELNGMLVQSGSMGHAFDALGKAARGDLSGAVDELTKAAASLLTAGEHFKVLGKELPFGMQGAKALGKLFERFVDAMPPGVKARILQEAAKIGARSVLNFIPFIGPVINGVGDGKQLWDDLHKQPRDNVQIALDAAQLGIDVASLVPGLNAVTGPLKMALGAIRVVKGAADFIGDLNEFKRAFTGIGQ